MLDAEPVARASLTRASLTCVPVQVETQRLKNKNASLKEENASLKEENESLKLEIKRMNESLDGNMQSMCDKYAEQVLQMADTKEKEMQVRPRAPSQ